MPSPASKEWQENVFCRKLSIVNGKLINVS